MAWSVTFNKNSREGREVPLDCRFTWHGCDFWIPAAYVCEEGLVLDICMETDRQTMKAFLDKWRWLFERERLGTEPTRQEYLQFHQENPLDRDFQVALECCGRNLQYTSGTGRQWIPRDLDPIFCDEMEMPVFMEQYGLSEERVWQFRRDKFLWGEAGLQAPASLSLTLTQRPRQHFSSVFTPKEEGERFVIPSPLDGREYILTVTSLSPETVDAPKEEGLQFPAHCLRMGYTMEPEIFREIFSLADVCPSDQPRRTGKGTVIGGAIGVIMRDREHPERPMAVSSLHFEPVETVTWQAVFRAKTVEDMTVMLK